MVGVPRSKGCRICVQRRVRCDQTRPFCSNCMKGNRPCPGYGQDMKFQDEGPKLRQRYEKKATDEGNEESQPQQGPSDSWADVYSSSSSSSAQPSPNPNEWDLVGLEVQRTQRPRIFDMLSNRAHVHSSDEPYECEDDISSLNPISRLNFDTPFDFKILKMMLFSPDLQQNQLLHIFTTAVSPANQVSLWPEMRNHGRWLSNLPPLAGANPLLDTAVRAVTLAHLGRQQVDESLLVESRPYYGKALRLLNAALLDDVQGMSNETLSATILLSFYEMFCSDSNDSWVRHAGGAGTLMRIRGAARHRYGFDREIFLAYRHALVIEAFQHDSPSFLDQPEWRELSRQIHRDIRSTVAIGDHTEVFDSAEDFYVEMAQIPGVLHDARHFSVLGEKLGDLGAAKTQVLEQAVKHRANLKKIFARFSAALRNLGHAPTSFVSGDPVIPIYYKYVNVFVASSHVGYWTLLILLNMICMDLDTTGKNAGLYAMESREASLDCCRSEPYMESSSFLGPFFVIFALRQALMILEPKQEREWVIKKLFHIGNTNMAMAKHMPEPNDSLPLVRQAVREVERMRRLEKEALKGRAGTDQTS